MPQDQDIRNLVAKMKLIPIQEFIEGKRLLFCEDSIVRGTTSRKIVTMVREFGAKEVHLRISCAPTIAPCFYGIDMPTRSELIASAKSIGEIRKYLGVDSLGYLSLEGMLSMNSLPDTSFCTACFSGRYPTEIESHHDGKMIFEVESSEPPS